MPTRHDAVLPNAAEEPVETTLLELVQSIVWEGGSEDEIVAAVLELVDSEEVVLIGNFRGERLECGVAEGGPCTSDVVHDSDEAAKLSDWRTSRAAR
jgi:hypothetical protein